MKVRIYDDLNQI